MSKYKILFVTMNYTIPVNGVAECDGVKFWFKYKNIDTISNIDYNNIEYIISSLSDDDYKMIYKNHLDFCKKLGKQFYHTNDDDLIIINNMKKDINNEDKDIDIKVEDIDIIDEDIDIKDENENEDKDEDKVKQIKEKFESMMNSVVHINKIDYMKIKGNYIKTIKSDDFINFNGTNIVNNKI
jgi:hypothetical protein